MAQAGSDLGVYPTNFNKYYSIAYGILDEAMDLDPNITYDYHTGFDIQPTKVVYNVDLHMNRKKILNIVPDKSRNNSAATVKMVKDLETKLAPYSKNNVYREIFEEFYDFSDASNYKLTLGASGITFTGINPNITFQIPAVNSSTGLSLSCTSETMSRFEINSSVRKKKIMTVQRLDFVGESKHQLSSFYFGSENPNFRTNVGIVFQPFFSDLWLFLK